MWTTPTALPLKKMFNTTGKAATPTGFSDPPKILDASDKSRIFLGGNPHIAPECVGKLDRTQR